MVKRITLLVAYFMIITTPLYAQIATPWLFRVDKLPPPKDPRECGTMQLSQADLEHKDKAENYMKQA